MEKILTHEGRQVRFKATAALPLRYKAQFGRDMVSDMALVQKSWHSTEKIDGESYDFQASGFFDENLDLGIVYGIIWAMAKTADKAIDPPMEWFDSFEDGLPVFEWFSELSDMLLASFSGTRKN